MSASPLDRSVGPTTAVSPAPSPFVGVPARDSLDTCRALIAVVAAAACSDTPWDRCSSGIVLVLGQIDDALARLAGDDAPARLAGDDAPARCVAQAASVMPTPTVERFCSDEGEG